MANLPNEQMGNATGIFNLMRNIGGSFGISLATTLVARGAQAHQAMMVGHLSPYDPHFQQYLRTLTGGCRIMAIPPSPPSGPMKPSAACCCGMRPCGAMSIPFACSRCSACCACRWCGCFRRRGRTPGRWGSIRS